MTRLDLLITVSLTVLVTLAAATAYGADAEELRTWTDASGKFTTKAKLLSVTNGLVSLEKESGTVLTIPIGRLTGADQEYVKQRTARPPLAKPDDAKPKPVRVSPREITPPEPGVPNQRAEFEQALKLLGVCVNFSLIGKSAGADINMEEIEVIRGDGEVMEHLKNTLVNKPLSPSLHSATTYLVGKGHKGFLQHVIIQGSETPAIFAVKKVLGEETSKEVRGDLPLQKDGSLIDMEAKPAKIVWYNYGWLRFGVLNDKIVMMIAGLGGPK